MQKFYSSTLEIKIHTQKIGEINEYHMELPDYNDLCTDFTKKYSSN